MKGKNTKPIFKINDKVRVKNARDKIGIIIESPQLIAGDYWYRVFFDKDNVENYREADLELVVESPEPYSLLIKKSLGNKGSFSKYITYQKLKYPLTDTIYAFNSARIEFHPYQFKPLLKFVNSQNKRLLIADEVGLGKTIEAGLVMLEEKARHGLDRILVVCPSSLREKWRIEMSYKFNEEFEIMDGKKIIQFLRDVQLKDSVPKLKAICSLQTIRDRKILDELEKTMPPIDLVIIDEAHHMRNKNTLAHRLGKILSECAEAMLLLTATPVHLGSRDLFNLLHILDPREFERFDVFEWVRQTNIHIVRASNLLSSSPPDLNRCKKELKELLKTSQRDRFMNNPVYLEVLDKLEKANPNDLNQLVEIQRALAELNLFSHIVTRTRKRDVDLPAKRIPSVLKPRFTPEELEFYNMVVDYVINKSSILGMKGFGAFAAMMPQRQVASCIPAMVEYYSQKWKDELQMIDDVKRELFEMDWEDWVNESNEWKSQLDKQLVEYYMYLAKLVKKAEEFKGIDSKFDALIDLLRQLDIEEPGEKIVIFSYFKKTLSYLSRRLNKLGYSNIILSGDVPVDQRIELIERFKDDPQIRILLSTEVGSEGLDFQFCHIMINYDLPWNPMVVEQRIGRLDRFGQSSPKILIYNFAIPGTIEEKILHRLYERIRIFEESIGDLEAIIGDEIKNLTIELLSSKLTPKEQEERISKVAEIIEKRKRDLYLLERESQKFLGEDEYFKIQLNLIQKRKQFITQAEIKIFISEFLNDHFPEWELAKMENDNLYTLRYRLELDKSKCHRLPDFIRNQLDDIDEKTGKFLASLQRGKILITFDGEEALKRERKVELINIFHPLIRAIFSYYKQHENEFFPTARIKLTSENFPYGIYLYMVYLLKIHAANTQIRIEPVFIDLQTLEPLSDSFSYQLLAEMITKGETLQTEIVNKISTDLINEAYKVCDDYWGIKIKQKEHEIRKYNDLRVSNQIASLEQTFKVKYNKRKELLEKAVHLERNQRYIRMLKGYLRKLERDFEQAKRELEEKRKVSISFERIAGGILQITK